jgi:hypothetical protein
MNITQAIAQLTKEQEFLGIGFLELLQDIQENGDMVYCPRTMTAFRVFMADATQLFA